MFYLILDLQFDISFDSLLFVTIQEFESCKTKRGDMSINIPGDGAT